MGGYFDRNTHRGLKRCWRYARFIAAKTGAGTSTGEDERNPAHVIIRADNFRIVVTCFQPAAVGGMKTRRRQYDGAVAVVRAVPLLSHSRGEIPETWVMRPSAFNR